MADLGHAHLLRPGQVSTRPPLVLLHGSGGGEQDLVPLASGLAPGVAALAVRGNVAWENGSAFFRRFADRTIDTADILERAAVLAGFIARAGACYGFAQPPIAVGYSNGAIMAAALLLLHPGVLSGALLLRPLLPFAPEPAIRIPATPVLIVDGDEDVRRSPGDGRRLADRLELHGARVEHHVLATGHAITALDNEIARRWLATAIDGDVVI